MQLKPVSTMSCVCMPIIRIYYHNFYHAIFFNYLMWQIACYFYMDFYFFSSNHNLSHLSCGTKGCGPRISHIYHACKWRFSSALELRSRACCERRPSIRPIWRRRHCKPLTRNSILCTLYS